MALTITHDLIHGWVSGRIWARMAPSSFGVSQRNVHQPLANGVPAPVRRVVHLPLEPALGARSRLDEHGRLLSVLAALETAAQHPGRSHPRP